jgi:hypothetical protein
MNRTSWWGWIFAAVWTLWLAALQGFVVARSSHGAWMPDLALALALALAGHIAREDLPKLALALAAARAAVSIDPPVAIFAAYLCVFGVAHVLRGVFDISSPMPRGMLTFASALFAGAWLELVHRVRDARDAVVTASDAGLGSFGFDVLRSAWPSALTTALAAVIAGPALARLPGLNSLWKKRPWRAVASLR